MKQWTVMVYLAGDNNLDSAGVADLGEMKKVGSNDDINVVAQFDRRGNDIGTARYYLRAGTTLKADMIGASLGETDDGDPKALESFIRWAMKSYPAKHYLVVLWNHGNGWDDTDVYAGERSRFTLARRGRVLVKPKRRALAEVSIADAGRMLARPMRRAFFVTSAQKALAEGAASEAKMRGILYDDNAKDFLDNIEMKAVFASVSKSLRRKIDIVGMDACLMSMAEVAYQIRDSAAFVVGSEQTEPGEGWPYDDVLAALAKTPSMAPADFARTIVKKYLASYGANAGVTQAACDLSGAPKLYAAISALGKALSAGLRNERTLAAIQRVRGQVQSYETADNVDLCDLCNLLADALASASPISRACRKVLAVVSSEVVIEHGSKGKSVANSNGMAIYFPTGAVSPLYANLDFAKKSGWSRFIAGYVAAVQRRPRR
jgi:hypothetical protein